MKTVIYHCFGGSHSSVTAAGIHLGILDRHRLPTAAELMQVPHFDSYEQITHGHFRLVGRTRDNQVIYVLGKKTLGSRISDLLVWISMITGSHQQIFPVDTAIHINLLMIIGGFLSRFLNLVAIGRPIVVCGTRFAYRKLVNQIDQVQEQLRLKQGSTLSGKQLWQRVICYVTDRDDLPALLVAGYHLYPGYSDQQIFQWANSQHWIGKIGEVRFLDRVGGYQHYLVGGQGGVPIVGRMLREVRQLLDIPQSDLVVIEPDQKLTLSRRIQTMLSFLLKGGWSQRQAQQLSADCRRKAIRIKRKIQEGVLD